MRIAGLQKLSLLDYPGEIACTVFLSGCNLRCPFCHNASLVLPERQCDEMSEDELFSFLDSRRGKLTAVCISGGEPTVQRDTCDLIKRIKDMGLRVKLDTNGTNPGMLKYLVSEGLVDYVAMDIKSSREGYAAAVGIEGFDTSRIEESAEYLMSCGIDFEFRTTVTRELHTENEIISIGKWLTGGEKYFLQTFRDSSDLVGEGMSAYSEAEMKELAKILCKFVPLAQIR